MVSCSNLAGDCRECYLERSIGSMERADSCSARAGRDRENLGNGVCQDFGPSNSGLDQSRSPHSAPCATSLHHSRSPSLSPVTTSYFEGVSKAWQTITIFTGLIGDKMRLYRRPLLGTPEQKPACKIVEKQPRSVKTSNVTEMRNDLDQFLVHLRGTCDDCFLWLECPLL